MSAEHVALVSLAATLLATLVLSTWRFSSLATRLLHAVQHLEEKEREQDARIRILDEIPAMRVTLETCVRHLSLVPKLESRVAVVETQQQHSKEWRREVLRQSRPDTDEE